MTNIGTSLGSTRGRQLGGGWGGAQFIFPFSGFACLDEFICLFIYLFISRSFLFLAVPSLTLLWRGCGGRGGGAGGDRGGGLAVAVEGVRQKQQGAEQQRG